MAEPKKFNPFELIIYLENIKPFLDRVNNKHKNWLSEYFKITLDDKSIDKITEEINKLQQENETENKEDFNDRIEKNIIVLKKMCNGENMMEVFMRTLYLIEKK